MSMPVTSGSAQCITPATSPSVISRIAAPVPRTSSIIVWWRGRSRMQTVMSDGRQPLAWPAPRPARRVHVQRHDPLGVARPDGELVHVDIGRVQHRAARPHGDHGQRVRHVLGGQRGAFQRVERDVHRGAGAVAHLFADEQHRGLVALALADHHDTGNVELVELVAHGVHRGLVGGLSRRRARSGRRRRWRRPRTRGQARATACGR